MTSVCPHCNRPHELYYWVEASGKKVISYTCDRYKQVKKVGDKLVSKTITTRIALSDQSPLPLTDERWSRGYSKKQNQRKSLQLILMK